MAIEAKKAEEKIRTMIINMLKAEELSISKIASYADSSEAYVLEIKESLDKK